MLLNQGIMWIIAIGILLGGMDRILGNRFGLGQQFEEGFEAMGALALGMVGMVCLSPVIATAVAPVISPAFQAIGADPAMFAGMVLPLDAGGYSLAMSLAVNEQAGLYSGLIVSSMLGCAMGFCVPVGLNLIQKEDQVFFFQGLLIGLISVPVGSIVGGILAGFDITLILVNSIPVIGLAALLALGIKLIPNAMIRGCGMFGKAITVVITVGLVAAAFEFVTGVVIIPGMESITYGMEIIGSIGVVLLGTFPILTLLIRLLNRPLQLLGQKMKVNQAATSGLVFMLANPVPAFQIMKDMNSRGKVVNVAWMVCATGALGDHLGFVAGVYPSGISSMLIGKIAGGIVAILLALVVTRNVDQMA